MVRCEELSLCMPRPLPTEFVAGVVSNAADILLCLDYDGTLAPIVGKPEEARPSKELLGILDRLAKHPHIEV